MFIDTDEEYEMEPLTFAAIPKRPASPVAKSIRKLRAGNYWLTENSCKSMWRARCSFLTWTLSNSRNRQNWEITTIKHTRNILITMVLLLEAPPESFVLCRKGDIGISNALYVQMVQRSGNDSESDLHGEDSQRTRESDDEDSMSPFDDVTEEDDDSMPPLENATDNDDDSQVTKFFR